MFLGGHVQAFDHFGGVPGRIRYDNLKPAVVRVMKGRDGLESERFVAMRSHYGFDSFFCFAGKDGAHEKGGVVGEVGRFRRRHMVPMPRVGSLAELNELMARADAKDDRRRISGRMLSVGEHFAVEAHELRPLPAEPLRSAAVVEQPGRRQVEGLRPAVLLLRSRPFRRHGRREKASTVDQIDRFTNDVRKAEVKIAGCEEALEELRPKLDRRLQWDVDHLFWTPACAPSRPNWPISASRPIRTSPGKRRCSGEHRERTSRHGSFGSPNPASRPSPAQTRVQASTSGSELRF